eukprot:3594609-Amphidinium_carterae.1
MTGLSGQVLSASLLASVTAVALLVRDLGKLQALQGAVAGTFLVFIGPSFMAAKLTKGRSRVRHLLVAGLGFLLGVAGNYSATSHCENWSSRPEAMTATTFSSYSSTRVTGCSVVFVLLAPKSRY